MQLDVLTEEGVAMVLSRWFRLVENWVSTKVGNFAADGDFDTGK